ncbi:MAG TPA: polyprenol monophosphomannose synthase [Terriglobales bacterium]|nr:polyprenol monophosphomannose synthase [Terriglobales bacterium]
MSSDMNEKLALVVPTLNEAGNIERLLNEVSDSLRPLGLPYEIVVVDDNSTDTTADIVLNYAQRDPHVRLLSRKEEKGLAGAVIHGWVHTDANLLGVIDADLQHPPSLLPGLLGAMADGSDIAIASRYAAKDGVKGWNPIRVAISRMSTLATLPFQRKGIRVKDPMSGFFIVRRDAIDGLEFESKGFKLLLEILVRGRIQSAKEIPFQFGLRHAGKSKAGTAVALHFLQLLGKLSRDLILKPSPQ